MPSGRGDGHLVINGAVAHVDPSIKIYVFFVIHASFSALSVLLGNQLELALVGGQNLIPLIALNATMGNMKRENDVFDRFPLPTMCLEW